jgi:hypothetical protein
MIKVMCKCHFRAHGFTNCIGHALVGGEQQVREFCGGAYDQCAFINMPVFRAAGTAQPAAGDYYFGMAVGHEDAIIDNMVLTAEGQNANVMRSL